MPAPMLTRDGQHQVAWPSGTVVKGEAHNQYRMAAVLSDFISQVTGLAANVLGCGLHAVGELNWVLHTVPLSCMCQSFHSCNCFLWLAGCRRLELRQLRGWDQCRTWQHVLLLLMCSPRDMGLLRVEV